MFLAPSTVFPTAAQGTPLPGRRLRGARSTRCRLGAVPVRYGAGCRVGRSGTSYVRGGYLGPLRALCATDHGHHPPLLHASILPPSRLPSDHLPGIGHPGSGRPRLTSASVDRPAEWGPHRVAGELTLPTIFLHQFLPSTPNTSHSPCPPPRVPSRSSRSAPSATPMRL